MPDDLGAGHPQSPFASRLNARIERGMQRRFLDVSQIDRDLRDAVFLHEPADRLDVFQHPGDPDRFAIRIQHRFSRGVPSSVLTRPCSRTSNATAFARRTDFVFRLAL